MQKNTHIQEISPEGGKMTNIKLEEKCCLCGGEVWMRDNTEFCSVCEGYDRAKEIDDSIDEVIRRVVIPSIERRENGKPNTDRQAV